jgi:hypothetical protein
MSPIASSAFPSVAHHDPFAAPMMTRGRCARGVDDVLACHGHHAARGAETAIASAAFLAASIMHRVHHARPMARENLDDGFFYDRPVSPFRPLFSRLAGKIAFSTSVTAWARSSCVLCYAHSA